jgi:hypothetical protein
MENGNLYTHLENHIGGKQMLQIEAIGYITDRSSADETVMFGVLVRCRDRTVIRGAPMEDYSYHNSNAHTNKINVGELFSC